MAKSRQWRRRNPMNQLCSIIIRNVPLATRKELRIAAMREGKPMQTLIVELIEKYLEEVRDDNPRKICRTSL
jgi:predicted DNA-binding protein